MHDTDPLTLTLENLRDLGLVLDHPEGGVLGVLPILRNRAEFAHCVRSSIHTLHPTAIGIPVLPGVHTALQQATRRLPLLSAVQWHDPGAHDRPILWPIHPADPIVEAVRSADEHGLALLPTTHPCDPVQNRAMPDPAAAEHVGMTTYLRHALAVARAQPRSRGASSHPSTILGWLEALPHLGAGRCALLLAELSATPMLIGAARQAVRSAGPPAIALHTRRTVHASVFQLDGDSARSVLGEIPAVSAAYERQRGCPPANRGIVARWPQTSETGLPTPRMQLLGDLCRQTAKRYRRVAHTTPRPTQLDAMLRYGCKLARADERLVPTLFHLLLAARGYIDDDYADRLWSAATDWPWWPKRATLPTRTVAIADLDAPVRRVHLGSRARRRHLQLVSTPAAEDWREAFADADLCSHPIEDRLLEAFGQRLRRRTERPRGGHALESEPFSGHLDQGIDVRRTVRHWLSGTLYVKTRRATGRAGGPVVVIFDDEPLPRSGRAEATVEYPWMVTWHGEENDESDVALYASNPFECLVGPGIARAVYGGLLLSRPPRSLSNVWDDADLRHDPPRPRSKGELLLRAALECDGPVAHVAARPPRRAFRELARRKGRHILHIPLGDLSPVTSSKIRRFHLLTARATEANANRHIL